jgi:RND family efflux transporter MFP subunit
LKYLLPFGALVITCILGACGQTKDATDADNAKITSGQTVQETNKSEEPEAKGEPIKVKVGTAVLKDLTPHVVLSGIVGALPDHLVKVTPALAGKLESVLVVDGQKVSKGQVVAVLVSTHLREQLEQSDAAVQVARTTVKQGEESASFARDNLERQKGLFQAEVSAKKDILAAQNQLQVALLQVQTAGAQLEAALAARKQIETEIGLTRVLSPISGVVANRYSNVNDTADLNTPIVQVVGLDSVLINASLPADAPEQPKTGQNAVIESPANPGLKYVGQVKTISPVVDRTTNTVMVQILCRNGDNKLKEGQNVKVTIDSVKLAHMIVVPEAALIPDPQKAGGQMLLVVEAGKAHKVAVQTGLSQAGAVQITSGIKPGQKIVVEGAFGLPDDAPVKENEAGGE